MFLGKGVPKICSDFTVEHPCRNAISIKLQSNFIEIALRHGYSPVNLRHIFGAIFPKNTSGWLLLQSESIIVTILPKIKKFRKCIYYSILRYPLLLKNQVGVPLFSFIFLSVLFNHLKINL